MSHSILNRQELVYLQKWAKRSKRKPLIIRGARQVGKSTLVRQFAKKQKLDLLEINFERNPEFREVFATKNPLDIIASLQLLVGQNIRQGKTLLFLDEIQAAPEALLALRYFYEEKPRLPVLAAGSLLEFTLAKAQFSMPVGRVEYLHLGPMQFFDFLRAMQESKLADYLKDLTLKDIIAGKMLAAVHQKYLSFLQQYFITGGLPEAVASYAANRNFQDTSRILQNIVATYRDDFHKYSGSSTQLVQLIFDRLPLMVGRKFTFAQISRDHRAAALSQALEHLCHARVAHKVFHTSASGLPLAAEVNPRYFKAVYLDVGLLSAALKVNMLDAAKKDITFVNNGALAEQFIGQHLLYRGEFYEEPQLYYWVREAKSAAAEIDYLITFDQTIVPVEIKAGKTGTLKSLHQFLKEKKRGFGLRFNADCPSLFKDKKQLTNGSSIKYQLLSLPLYMVEEAGRLVGQCLAKG